MERLEKGRFLCWRFGACILPIGTAYHDLTIRTAVSGWDRRVGMQKGSFGDNRAIVIHGTHSHCPLRACSRTRYRARWDSRPASDGAWPSPCLRPGEVVALASFPVSPRWGGLIARSGLPRLRKASSLWAQTTLAGPVESPAAALFLSQGP